VSHIKKIKEEKFDLPVVLFLRWMAVVQLTSLGPTIDFPFTSRRHRYFLKKPLKENGLLQKYM
jgi:hypothetical protein